MKRFFLMIFAVAGLLHRESAAANVAVAPSTASEILKASSQRELSRVSAAVRQSLRRARGCEIQRQEGVPPTLCYPSKDVERLDLECARASRTAIHIPVADEFTSPACRIAIEKRSADLVYATKRDASR